MPSSIRRNLRRSRLRLPSPRLRSGLVAAAACLALSACHEPLPVPRIEPSLDGWTQPYRVRIRPPSFVNLQALDRMARGALIADLVAIIGTIDIVLGEVDR